MQYELPTGGIRAGFDRAVRVLDISCHSWNERLNGEITGIAKVFCFRAL